MPYKMMEKKHCKAQKFLISNFSQEKYTETEAI